MTKRLSRTLGVLAALGALAAAPAHAQAAPPATPAPSAPAPAMPPSSTPAPGLMKPDTVQPGQTTLTPPGSSTAVPLLPTPPDGAGAGLPALPNLPSMPSAPSVPALPGPPPALPAYPGPTGPARQNGAPTPGPSFGAIFSNTAAVPLRLTLGQLTSDWRRMTVTESLDFGTVTQVVSSLLGSAGVGAYYTQGQTVTLGSVTYLVAYQTQPRALDVAALLGAFRAVAAKRPPAAAPLTAQTPLALALLNLQTAGSLTDVRAFDLNRELAESAAAVRAYDALIGTFRAGSPPPAFAPRVGRPKPRRTPSA